MRLIPLLLFCALLAPAQRRPASGTEAMYQAAADSAEAKFQHIRENSRRDHPDQAPTVLTQNEVNAYLASGRVDLPTGVRQVRFSAHPGKLQADARIDFDAITAARRSSNPLLTLFQGVHDVVVAANAEGSGGVGHVHITQVEIDGVTVPRIALEYFVDHYLKPKHPEIGLDTDFRMPDRIDLAILGDRKLTVTQK